MCIISIQMRYAIGLNYIHMCRGMCERVGWMDFFVQIESDRRRISTCKGSLILTAHAKSLIRNSLAGRENNRWKDEFFCGEHGIIYITPFSIKVLHMFSSKSVANS